MPDQIPRPRRRYARCPDQTCGQSDCPRCHPALALDQFLAEVRGGTYAQSRGLPEQPVLLYHVPRTGGSFLSTVFHRLGILLVRPDQANDSTAVDERLQRGEGRGIVMLGHSAARVKARHPDVEFLEFAVCWRDPFEICSSEFHWMRKAPPNRHNPHNLRDHALNCDSVADFVEQFRRGNPISNVLRDNRPTMLRSSHYEQDVAAMLQAVLGYPVDLAKDFGFDASVLRPGRWAIGADRDELARLHDLNALDYELWKDWVQNSQPMCVP